ncbi:SIR2 family protein [Actinosynnema sp. NPDC047251]|uniref:SIR2 family protein n=1 Tax=Saccharothrix espanaensis TaxID=103731 RepID=UPI00059D86FC|nr:SIR2 family protein [Saccharothrix espanaensis]
MIDRVAARQSLVIYAGAGVTIDRTGLSWPALVENLLSRQKSPAVADAIMKTNTPLQAASVVAKLYADRSVGWETVLVNDIRTLLYGGRAWQQGELARAVVSLAAELVDNGKEFFLTTTNYDEFIQQEVDLLNLGRRVVGLPPVEARVSVIEERDAALGFEVADHTRPGQILHLHGHVPNGGGRQRATVVLSERDYMVAYDRSSAVLEELFRRHSVIVLGSSLTDPPLLRALAATIPEADEDRIRVAVVPLQGMGFPAGAEATVDDVKDSVVDRMSSFGVQAVVPDFYYQVAQLVTEIKICLRRRNPAVPKLPTRPYRQRLGAWWNSWSHESHGTLEQRQHADHDALDAALQRIRTALSVPHGELMKLEIWVRRDPVETGRLWLWASTASLWRNPEMMRYAEIVADSEYESVRAFCAGRPVIYPDDGDTRAGRSDRWLTYLCVPIRLDERSGDLPVGVISLASMRPKSSSKINERHGARIGTVIAEHMRAVAELIIRK